MRPFRLAISLAGAAALAAGAYALARWERGRHPGSQTNASDVMDDVELGPRASSDEVVDAGGKESFPASDPLAVQDAAETAYEREQRGRTAPSAPASPARSPDWLKRK